MQALESHRLDLAGDEYRMITGQRLALEQVYSLSYA